MSCGGLIGFASASGSPAAMLSLFSFPATILRASAAARSEMNAMDQNLSLAAVLE